MMASRTAAESWPDGRRLGSAEMAPKPLLEFMHAERFDRTRLFTAGAATLAAFLYAARSIQALAAGELDHMAHNVRSGQPLVIGAAAAMAAALLGLRAWGPWRPDRRESRLSSALLVAAIGLLWVGTARLIELLGAAGPWGLYSGPGLVAFLGGVMVTGLMLTIRDSESRRRSPLGPVLLAIALLRAAAGLVSMTLFNLLGRDLGANLAATQAGQAVRLIEALCWLAFAVLATRANVLSGARRTG